jgi:OOP family OmpA-OmpF porin
MSFASDLLAVGDETGYGGPDFLGLATISVNVGATRPKLFVADRVVEKDPETLDDDGDGLINRADRCPKVAEDIDRWEDEDGCPDEDNDKDGLADAKDRCPLRAETRNQIDDDDGCPEEDADGDAIVGTRDQCPDTPEVRNGFKDGDGCADTLPGELQRFSGPVPGITFRGQTAVLVRSANSLLDQAVAVMKQYPELKFEIGGHTEGRGNSETNRALSQKRADRVREYLISKGIEPARIVAVGYGNDRPIDSARSAAGRAKNKRIEFRLLTAEAAPAETGAPASTPPGNLPPAVPAESAPPKPVTP